MRINSERIKTFNLTDFLKVGEVFHYSKVTLFEADDIGYHKHNYFEVFCIENGTGEQFRNNTKVNLHSGIISFINKDDIHYFKPKDKVNGLTIHNIAFLESDFARYKNLYPALIDKYFDHQISFNLTREKLSRLLNFIQHHQNKPRDLFHLDLIILWIFSLLEEIEERNETTETPGWLKYAADTFVKPSNIGFSMEQFV